MKHLLTIISFFSLFTLSAQEVKLDTLRLRQILTDTTLTLSPIESQIMPHYNFDNNKRNYRDSIDTSIPDIVPTNIEIATPGESNVIKWHNGAAVASGSIQEMPGSMAIESGAITMYQHIGNLTLGIGGDVSKYGYFRGLDTQYGVDAMMNYRFNESTSATLFGDYYFGDTPNLNPHLGAAMTPAQVGYYNATHFGGFISHDFSRRWGIDLGAQTYQPLGSSRWEVAPIAAPYLRLNNGQKIGIDLGGILYELLKNSSGKTINTSPTIAPPKLGLGAIGH
jgi:hypothetical protein